ncbi:hypothetical protein BDR05DRAFT_868954, partial [Suillus weaverae]
MTALLEQHDAFIKFPPLNSDDAARAHHYVQSKSCPEWQNGILAVDGSFFNLHQKPGHYGESFYSRKSQYSLNCQAVIMPHNLIIADYSIGHTGSAHDA